MSRLISLRSALVSLATALLIHASPALAEAQKVGVVGALSGNVSAIGENGQSRVLKTGDDVFLNEAINSGPAGKVQIMFLDKSSLMINPDSSVTVDKFVFNPATSTGDLTIQNTKGALRFIGGALSKEKPVHIKTPVATIGIRGGIADTHVAAGGATDAIFVYGEEMTMTNANGQTSSVTTPGQGLGLTTPTGLPVQLPPERVMQHLQSFSAGDSGDMSTSNNSGSDDIAPQNSDGQNTDGKSNEDGSSDGSTPDGNKDQPAGNQQGDSKGGQPKDAPKKDGDQSNAVPKKDGDQIKQGNKGSPPNGPVRDNKVASNNDNGRQGSNAPPPNAGFTGDVPTPPTNGSPPNGPTPGNKVASNNGNGTQGGNTPTPNAGFTGGVPTPPTNGAFPTPGGSLQNNVGTLQPHINNTNVLSNSTQSNQTANNTAQYSTLPTNPTLFGRYAMTEQNSATTLNSGTAGFERVGTRQNGRLTQTNPSGGVDRAVSLPWLTNSSFHGSNTSNLILVDNKAYLGQAFISPDLAMNYYQLQEVGGNKRIGTVFGRVAPTSSWTTSAATSAITADNSIVFYDFLPELDYNGSSSFGFFDYNVADNRLAPNTSSAQIGNMGLAVDWTHQRYLSGHLIWESDGLVTSSNPLKREMVLSFGKTNNGGRLLDGRYFEFGSKYTANGADQGLAAGFVRVLDAYSVANGAPFSGFIAEGVLPGDDLLDGSDATFNANVAGEHGFQPLVVNYDADDPTSGERHTRTTNGYAAGFMVTNSTPSGGATTRTFTRYATNTVGDVEIGTNATTSNVTGKLMLENTANIVYDIEVRFGNFSGLTADSAFLTDDYYAAQQSKITYINGGGNVAYSGNAVDNSAIVSASLISDVNASCTACEYVDWGVWAGEIDRSSGSTHIRDVASMIPYVAGEVTQNLISVSALSLGNVTYDGVMYGSVLNGGVLSRSTGDFTAGINLNTRQLNSFNGNFAGMNFYTNATTNIVGTGDAQFYNVNVAGAGGVSGKINGALFGPQAQDIAGNFAVSNSTKDAAGIYLGSRQ